MDKLRSLSSRANILLILAALLGTSSAAWAGPYSFGGSCASIGAWTEQALAQTAAITQIVESLKNNPDCKGLESVVAGFQVAEATLKPEDTDRARATRLETLPAELSGLRTYLATNSSLKEDISQLLFDRTLEGASLAASETGAAVRLAGPLGTPAMAALLSRGADTAKAGLAMFERYAALLPTYDRCLVGNPDQGMALLGASVKLAAAFASSNDGIASQIGGSIGSLLKLVRDRRFSSVLRKLDETQFWISLSCLIETTSQNYCSAQDVHALLEDSGREQFDVKQVRTDDPNNPLEGYVLLVRELDEVSRWLQQIQIGNKPKLRTDAQFKRDVLVTINNFNIRLYEISAAYTEDFKILSTLTNPQAKKNYVLEMVKRLNDQFINVPGDNFFTMSMLGDLVPFYLIGLNEIPEPCAPKAGGFAQPWPAWMQNQGRFQSPFFDDPEALALRIGVRVEELIEKAQRAASAYYMQRMVVDMANTVNQSVASPSITVLQSLKNISSYLDRLAERVSRDGGDIVVLGSLRDTQLKIDRVLDSYADLRAVNASFEADFKKLRFGRDDQSQAILINDRMKVKAAYQKVIDVVYDELNILMQRDTLLSTRMATFVQLDYALRIRNHEKMSPYMRELMVVSGRNLVDRMVEMMGKSLASRNLDLNAAGLVNKENIANLDQMFSDNLIPILEELDLIAKGKRPSNGRLALNSLARLLRDSTGPSVASPLAIPVVMLWKKLFHSDQYPLRWLGQGVRPDDNEYGDIAKFKAKLCIQTLAFPNRNRFWSVCHGSVLSQGFGPGQRTIDVRYDDFFKLPPRASQLDVRTNESRAICALRDFQRKSMVYQMTLEWRGRNP
jgi:hypothetical protein